MKAEYVTLLTIFVSLLSGWGGAFITGYLSRKSSTDSIERTYELEDKKRKEKEKRIVLNLYINIIKLDYETNPVVYGYNGEAKFDFVFYENEIRPRIYENYELIQTDVIKHFNEIEEVNSDTKKRASFDLFDEMDVTDITNHIAHSYDDMVNEIKLIVDGNRLKK